MINYCFFMLFIYIHLKGISLALPIETEEIETKALQVEYIFSDHALGAFLGFIFTLCFIFIIGACICCGRHHLKFQWPRRHSRRVVRSSTRSSFPSNDNEISIFPPPGAEEYLSSSSSNIYFEPLPDIASQFSDSRYRPARLSASVSSNLNEDWFAEPYNNFPRNQLQYVKKLGSGWFGQVLEGRAIGIDTDHTSTVITKDSTSKSTPVVVKALREDALPQEQAFFLQELIPFRDLDHPNVLRIVAYCLETQPLLVLLQHCPKGNLKSLLKRDITLTESNLLKMAGDVAAGLAFMHQNNFIHTDLAARNCLVEENLNVKVGDYGCSLEAFQQEYYLAENVALPIRWCAPETLKCTETTIETIQLTQPSNVWSFGVLFWEILSRGKLPYHDLDDDDVIQKVVLERSRNLTVPGQYTQAPYAKHLAQLLSSSFCSADQRPKIDQIRRLLDHLISCLSSDSSENDFESRWNRIQAETRQQAPQQHNISNANNSLDLRFESNFNPACDLDSKGSPTPSLKKLHGSAEDLEARVNATLGPMPSWLGLEPGQTMDSFTEEISDAIQRLDEALSEGRSEATTATPSPEKHCVRFKLFGSDSLVSNPPAPSGEVPARSITSEGEDEHLTMRLEQGDFSELVRLKSQSVQDFMRLTVVDDGSDSSDRTSQPGSLLGEAPPSHGFLPQEKSFSSESNLKEAVRDAGFMVELERLQAEHKFSIISEASKEGLSSIEFASYQMQDVGTRLSPEGMPEAPLCMEDNTQELKTRSFLGEMSPSPPRVKGDVTEEPFVSDEENVADEMTNIPKKEANNSEKSSETTFLEASPDCIVSSRRGHASAPLPDILSHDENIRRNSSEESSLEEENEEAVSHCREDHGFTEAGKEVERMSDEFNERYLPERVVHGEDVVIGALDHYSLELFKPAKSFSANESLKADHVFIVDKSPSISNSHNSINNLNSENESSISHCKVDTNINHNEENLVFNNSSENECKEHYRMDRDTKSLTNLDDNSSHINETVENFDNANTINSSITFSRNDGNSNLICERTSTNGLNDCNCRNSHSSNKVDCTFDNYNLQTTEANEVVCEALLIDQVVSKNNSVTADVERERSSNSYSLEDDSVLRNENNFNCGESLDCENMTPHPNVWSKSDFMLQPEMRINNILEEHVNTSQDNFNTSSDIENSSSLDRLTDCLIDSSQAGTPLKRGFLETKFEGSESPHNYISDSSGKPAVDNHVGELLGVNVNSKHLSTTDISGMQLPALELSDRLKETHQPLFPCQEPGIKVDPETKCKDEKIPTSERDNRFTKPAVACIENHEKESQEVAESERESIISNHLENDWDSGDKIKLSDVKDDVEIEALSQVGVAAGHENDKESCQESATQNAPQDSEEFWERQMVAWKEAAAQTRDLLNEAANKELRSAATLDSSEEDLLDISSEDRLDDTDDEGTYVSYDMTDDNDVVERFNSDELDALRSELRLKLNRDANDQAYDSDENRDNCDDNFSTSNDLIFINYKNGCPSNLSPIKEEEPPLADTEGKNSIESMEQERSEKDVADLQSMFGGATTTSTSDVLALEAKDSLIIEDLDCQGTPPPPKVVGLITPRSAGSEDMLLVDTETNKITLVDSERPQSHIAFLAEKLDKSDEIPECAIFPPQEEEEDDVAFESLPYENTSSGSFTFARKDSKEKVDRQSLLSIADDGSAGAKEVVPLYQSYFTSCLPSVTYPTPSLEGHDAFESADHVSLPYDVNLPLETSESHLNALLETVGEETPFPEISSPKCEKHQESSGAESARHSSETVHAQVSDSSVKKAHVHEEEISPFVTLSFLGQLYKADGENESNFTNAEADQAVTVDDLPSLPECNSSMEQFFSTKSDTDSSDNEIEEEISQDPNTEREKVAGETTTPVRTPSHLTNFVWRADTEGNGAETERYTPDWESDSDANEDMESSSTSGEFVWQPGSSDGYANSPLSGVCIPSMEKTSLEWQRANDGRCQETVTPPLSEGEGSESGEEEFTPSTWNKELTPHRSLLKSPETNQSLKKSVSWKRQRHHRVYEYPPEPQSWHAEVPKHGARRSWGAHTLDYLTLADWELGGEEFLGDDSEDFEEFYPRGSRGRSSAPQIYNLAPLTFENKSHEELYGDPYDFFLSSQGPSLPFSRSSFTPAEFFQTDNSGAGNYNFIYNTGVSTQEEVPKGLEEATEPPLPSQEPLRNTVTPQSEASISRENLRLDLAPICLTQTQCHGEDEEGNDGS